jgi:diguanylate cyclase (GGDEF)-like protein
VIAVIMLDVDKFKAFNDTYGHRRGDEILAAVAQSLSGTVHRPADFVGRYGGEEFVAVLPDTDLNGAQVVAEAMREAVQNLRLPHVGNAEGNFIVTASLGVATAHPLRGSAPDDLVRAADQALYCAKSAGRNRVEICPDLK